MSKTQAEKKQTKALPKAQQGIKPRQLKKPKYQSFHLNKRIKSETKLPSAFKLLKDSSLVVFKNWKLFLGIVILFGALNFVMVQGFNAASDFTQTKENLDQTFSGGWQHLAGSLSLLTYLLGSSGVTTNPASGVYQMIIVLVFSLALIWVLRQIYAGNPVRVRDGFYYGMTPFVTFVLVSMVVFLQLIPAALGLGLYAIVVGNEIAVMFVEQILWAIFAFIATIVSLYMISSSLFAMYIVTLPDMTPMKALRSARHLVLNRRWGVMRKVIFLPLALFVIMTLVILPFIFFAAPLAAWIFFILSIAVLPFAHSYMYSLYRSMV
jgi:hypothetical protein